MSTILIEAAIGNDEVSRLHWRQDESDRNNWNSSSYRLIYWLQFTSTVVLLDIYSKSEQESTEVKEVQHITAKFKQDQQEDAGANSNSNCDD
ncbi:MAG TPA: hypothetical protein V6C64_06945 [Microcoleaceae cyanobacterium]